MIALLLACAVTAETRTVRGGSMAGILEEGEEIEICRSDQPARGDLVALRAAGREDPLVKVVKAAPGDRFELRKAQDGWHLLVQGDLQRTSCGEPYLLGERAHRVLALYERGYGGVIPSGAFLVLGNLPAGTLDSTRLGLVGRGEILGKVNVAPVGRRALPRREKSRCAGQGAIK